MKENPMKASAITCVALAASLGFSTLASAQDRGGRRDDNPRAERREERRENRAERREERQERRFEQAQRQDRQEDRAFRQGYRQADRDSVYLHPSYGHQNSVYQQPRYYSQQRFQRGHYLPHEYRQSRYYVNDWHSHRGLYAPPQGQQWMQVGSEFVLVALATGLIANLLIQ
jgi:Ni/Co efflux regulator RcnB